MPQQLTPEWATEQAQIMRQVRSAKAQKARETAERRASHLFEVDFREAAEEAAREGHSQFSVTVEGERWLVSPILTAKAEALGFTQVSGLLGSTITFEFPTNLNPNPNTEE